MSTWASLRAIMSPDMVTVGRPDPDTRPHIEPKSSASEQFLRDLQPPLATDSLGNPWEERGFLASWRVLR